MRRALFLLLVGCGGSPAPKAPPAPDRASMACTGDPVAKESGQRASDLAADLEGLPITRIAVEGNRRIAEEDIRIPMGLKNGDRLSHAAVAKGIAAVYPRGELDDIQVFARQDGEGVILDLIVLERMRVAEIFAPGMPETSKDEMAKWIGVAKGKPFDVADVSINRRQIAETMTKRGAKLDVRTHVLANGELDVCILVQQ